MDRLEAALRRYRQIVPEPVGHIDVPMEDITVWVREDVIPVLEDYSARVTFRRYASWPITALSKVARTEERALIERVDEGLVKSAKALLEVGQDRKVVDAVAEKFPATQFRKSESMWIDANTKMRANSPPRFVEPFEWELGQLRQTAGRNWDDLVNPHDYFEPQQEWVEGDDGRRVQRAAWIVSLNRELLPIGNFVVRCLLKRVESRMELLKEVRKKCRTVISGKGSPHRQLQQFESRWSELTTAVDRLQRALRTGKDATLRDAAVVVTQCYAAFHPDPDLDWLGLPRRSIEHGMQALGNRITGLQNAHMLERIVVSLGDLRDMYAVGDPGLSAIEEAIGAGSLVLIEARRDAYWEGTSIKHLSKGDFRFLHALATKARRQSVVSERDLYDDDVKSDSAISSAWNRLKLKLPRSLWELVEPGAKQRTYKLRLDPQRIHILASNRVVSTPKR